VEPSYRKHLEDRKRRTLIMNGAILDSAFSQNLLSIVFLNTPDGISAFGDALAARWPALIDMGATYGTAFIDSTRPDVGLARGEGANLVTVSMVARLTEVLSWIDLSKIHPTLVQAIQRGVLTLFEGALFLRFPANDVGRNLGKYCVNEQGEIQVFCYPEDDPILAYLRQKHGVNYFEARSSNITGSPEEPFAPGAVEYACAIAAPIVAVSSFEALEAQIIDQALYKQGLINQMRRKRFGSFPIIRFAEHKGEPSERPVVAITRAGNTSPDTLTRYVKGVSPEALVVYEEEKRGHARHEYESPYTDPKDIQKDLIRAAREVNVFDVEENAEEILP
jgi:hypothetical protein